jgi:hypothetical protein
MIERIQIFSLAFFMDKFFEKTLIGISAGK